MQSIKGLFIVSILCPLITGCLAAGVVGGEVVSASATDVEERNGENIYKVANWSNAEDRTTKTLHGVEEWTCASVNRETATERDDFSYLCVKKNQEKIDFSKNTYYKCTDMRGGGFSVMLNDKNSSSLFCIDESKSDTNITQPPENNNSKVKVDKEMIKSVQQKLNDLGYKPGPADGLMGSNTRAALKKFQDDKGLSVSGNIDKATLNALSIN